MKQRTEGWLSGLFLTIYFIYIVFVGIIGSFILMPFQLSGPVYLGLALALVGAPAILQIVSEKTSYSMGLMMLISSVYIGIAYVNRVDVPDAQPERASAYATEWFAQVASNPEEAFKTYLGPKHHREQIERQLAKVGLPALTFDRVQKYAPEKVEGRGDCNIYDVMFLHPGGTARVGLKQCYDGGPEFEVSRADVTIDAEVIRNTTR